MEHETNAADRFAELPQKTREFLSKLDEEGIDTLDQGIRLVRATMTVGRFARWMIVGVLGLFVGASMFLDSLQKIVAWLNKP